MSNSRSKFTFRTEVGSEVKILVTTNKETHTFAIKDLPLVLLEQLENEIHVELLERDESYYNSMKDDGDTEC